MHYTASFIADTLKRALDRETCDTIVDALAYYARRDHEHKSLSQELASELSFIGTTELPLPAMLERLSQETWSYIRGIEHEAHDEEAIRAMRYKSLKFDSFRDQLRVLEPALHSLVQQGFRFAASLQTRVLTAINPKG